MECRALSQPLPSQRTTCQDVDSEDPRSIILGDRLPCTSLSQVNSAAGGYAAGSVPPSGAGLGSIPRWLLNAMAFSGCIPGGGEKTHIGLLAANPSKEHTVISLANDSTQTQKAKALERAIPTQLNNSLCRATRQSG